MEFLKPDELDHKGVYKTNDGRRAKVLGNVIVLYEIKEENGEETYCNPMHTIRTINNLKAFKIKKE